MLNIVVVGSILMDLVVVLKKWLKVGEIVIGEVFYIILGGKGVN